MELRKPTRETLAVNFATLPLVRPLDKKDLIPSRTEKSYVRRLARYNSLSDDDRIFTAYFPAKVPEVARHHVNFA